ncbi:hypothetical protein HDU81_003309 [Chytriomyces hyalinus]|nr:hypothetical protein HDU81_003309 [Chytriomyces hyalinus]
MSILGLPKKILANVQMEAIEHQALKNLQQEEEDAHMAEFSDDNGNEFDSDYDKYDHDQAATIMTMRTMKLMLVGKLAPTT